MNKKNHTKTHALKFSALAASLAALILGSAQATEPTYDIQSLDTLKATITATGGVFSGLKDHSGFGAVKISGSVDTASTPLTQLQFLNNVAGSGDNGGGLLLTGSSVKIGVTDAIFQGNSAGKNGGAVSVESGASLSGSATFFGNSATHGGGLSVRNDSKPSDTNQKVELTDSSFYNNTASHGGAAFFYNASGSFVDTSFVGNTAKGWGGALRLDASQVDVTLTSGLKMGYWGNTSGDLNSYTGKLYNGYTGGFAHLQGATLNFTVGHGSTLTIGAPGSASVKNMDSITSIGDTNSNKLTKQGTGTLVINSSTEGFTGTIDLQEGTLVLATGISNYDLNIQKALNSAQYSGTPAYESAINVSGGAKLVLGNTVVNHSISGSNSSPSGALTLTVSAEGEVEGGDLTLQKTTYTQTNAPASKQANTYTTLGGYLKINNSGDVSFENVSLQDQSTLDISGSGATVFDSLALAGQSALTISGVLIVDDGITLTKGAESNAPKVTLSAGGTLETGWKNLFVKTGESWGLTDFASAIKSGAGSSTAVSGSIIETEYTGTYTLDDLQKANSQFACTNGSYCFGFANASLKSATNGNEAWDSVSGTGANLGHSTVDVSSGTISTTGNLTVGALNVSGADVSTLQITVNGGSGKTLTLTGAQGSGLLFTGSNLTSVTTSGNVALGNDIDQKISVNVDDFKAENLTVHGTVDAVNVTIGQGSSSNNASGTIAGTLAVNSLTVSSGTTTVADGGLLVLKGVLPASTPTRAATTDLDGKVNVNGVLTTHRSADVQRLIQTYATGAVMYVDRPVKLGETANITIGTSQLEAYPEPATPTVTINQGGTLVVNATGFITSTQASETPEEGKVAGSATTDLSVLGNTTTVTNNGTIVLANVQKTGTVTLGSSASNGSGTIKTDNSFLTASGASGSVTISVANVFGQNTALKQLLESKFAQGLTSQEVRLLDAVGTQAAFFTAGDSSTTLNTQGQNALAQVTGGNVTSGVLNTAYDTTTQVVNAITRHQMDPQQGMGVWADVFYAQNRADSLYGSSGYKNSITGGIIGLDNTFVCGANAGFALSIGTADTKSVGGAFATSLDSDFWGVSAYARKAINAWQVKADLGYMDYSNSLSGLGAASDASTFTMGIRADFVAYDLGSVTVAPHFGLRYTHLAADAVAFNDKTSLNAVEMPVGLQVAGNLQTQSGWTIRPNVDFTIVPQLGGKTVNTFTQSDVTVLSSGLYNTTVGVAADMGATTVGVQAVYGFGPADRANTQVNVRAQYRF